MFDLDGFISTMIVAFMFVCFLTLLRILLDEFYKAVVYILSSIFGKDRNYDFVYDLHVYLIGIILICLVTFFWWHNAIMPLYNLLS